MVKRSSDWELREIRLRLLNVLFSSSNLEVILA